MKKLVLPDYITTILTRLAEAGFEAYPVGGSVRDWLLGLEPKDWDITTNARPEAILKTLDDSRYENEFGTVIVPVRDQVGDLITAVEVTTYRSEQAYSDHRRPDAITFEDSLDKDLARRDFTINALALAPDGEVVDLFGGEKDLQKKIIRTVGEPSDRFKEDALRMLRAVRLSCQLGFSIEGKTERGIMKMAGTIKFVANERIKDVFINFFASPRPDVGI